MLQLMCCTSKEVVMHGCTLLLEISIEHTTFFLVYSFIHDLRTTIKHRIHPQSSLLHIQSRMKHFVPILVPCEGYDGVHALSMHT